ncbi:MAG: tetratricopeptide repeat protein, partial [Planctomycetota bacterium]
MFAGQQYYQKQQWDKAADAFLAATKTSPDAETREKAFYRRGWSLFQGKKYEAAESAFAMQLQQFPKGKLMADAQLMVGESRFKPGKYMEALEAFKIARARIEAAGESGKTLVDPNKRQIRELVFLHGGQASAQLKYWDEALQWYTALRDRFPNTVYLPQSFYETGFAYQQMGDDQRAMDFFTRVASKYRNELAARSRFMIGEIHFGKKDYTSAITEFQRVMYGFNAEKAPANIKNWQAKSGFEAAKCAEVLVNQNRGDRRQQALTFATKFYQYVIDKHPQHELAVPAKTALQKLK